MIPQPEVTLLDSALLKISGHKKFDLYINPKNKTKEKRNLVSFLFFSYVQRLLAIGQSQPSSPNLKTSQHSYEGRITSDTVGAVKKRREGDFAFGLC